MLGYSLRLRIAPRLEFMAARGDHYALSTSMSPPHDKFCRVLGAELADYEAFKQRVIREWDDRHLGDASEV